MNVFMLLSTFYKNILNLDAVQLDFTLCPFQFIFCLSDLGTDTIQGFCCQCVFLVVSYDVKLSTLLLVVI